MAEDEFVLVVLTLASTRGKCRTKGKHHTRGKTPQMGSREPTWEYFYKFIVSDYFYTPFAVIKMDGSILWLKIKKANFSHIFQE